MTTYMLWDTPVKQSRKDILSKNIDNLIHVCPDQPCKSYKLMLKMCNKVICESNEGDTIICWYDFMGIICWYLLKLKGKKRNLAIVNILLKKKDTTKNKLARFLYRKVLNDKNVKATVTSLEYGKYLNNLLNINREYTLLHDVYYDYYDIHYKGEVEEKSVFVGGRNGRDWDFAIELAKNLPNIKFNVVMSNELYLQYKDKLTQNINVKYDLVEYDFLKELSKSVLVIMPLDTEAPAGLTVLFQAAANNKLNLATNTITTKEYLSNQRGILLSNDIDEWKDKIGYYLEHQDEANELVNNLKSYLEKECSEDNFASILKRLSLDNI